MASVIVTPEDAQGIIESLATAPIHVPVQAPRRFRVIESWPYRSHQDLVRVFVLHLLIKGLEVLLAPFAAVWTPSFRSRMHPGIETVKGARILRGRFVFVNQEWRRFPTIDLLTHATPIGVAALWKDKDHGPPLISEVSLKWGKRSQTPAPCPPWQSNGNMGAGNVSKLDIHSLLYPGASTKVYAHLMPWFGDPRHMNVGYNSQDPAQIHRQITDMISRGIDGVIIDWYGSRDTFSNKTTLAVMAEVEQHPGFTFAIMVDKGAIKLSSCRGCTPQQALIEQVQYVEQTFVPSPAYMRINGRPVITNFDIDLHYTIDWNAVNAATSTHPTFIFQHSGGFKHAVSGGSYSWVIVNVTDFGMSYLTRFYKAGLAAPQQETIGAAYKGFNDTLASWGQNRIVTQRCGHTWLQTFNEINSLYNSTNQLDALQLVTWNDYEEGTEIETGIDNCFSISAGMDGKSLQWKVNAYEDTIDHYVVYISTDGQNLMRLNTMVPGSRSLNLCSYSLASGNYVAFVQGVGKATLKNQMSNAVKFTAQCSWSLPPPSTATITLGATPTALNVTGGKSANSLVTVTPVSGDFPSSVSLSCSHLPAGAVCSFSPSAIIPGSRAVSSTLTISTGMASLPLHERNRGGWSYALLMSGFGVAGLSTAGSWSSRKRIWQILGLGTLVLVSCVFLSCGGGSSQIPGVVTAAGTFQITVHGDSGNHHTSTLVSLTIK